MTRIARLVGVDEYPRSPLHGCVADAAALQMLLERHDDGSANFNCRTLTDHQVTRASLRQAVEEVFTQRDVDVALFYFAGHGMVRGTDTNTEGVLQTVDGIRGDEGLTMESVIAHANHSPAKERIIILDCCHAGAIDQILVSRTPVPLAEGVSILAACRSDQKAVENGGRGLFSSHVCAALDGGAADLRGFVKATSVYAYVDEIMTPWDQRPLFRASVAGLKPLRRAKHAVSDDDLREIVQLFVEPELQYPLDESYERTVPSHDPGHVTIMDLLQKFRAARLVDPVGTPHMYYAAVERKSCQLTPLGRAYWHQVKNRRF
jgi:uncharacterized caspase-like protein